MLLLGLLPVLVLFIVAVVVGNIIFQESVAVAVVADVADVGSDFSMVGCQLLLQQYCKNFLNCFCWGCQLLLQRCCKYFLNCLCYFGRCYLTLLDSALSDIGSVDVVVVVVIVFIVVVYVDVAVVGTVVVVVVVFVVHRFVLFEGPPAIAGTGAAMMLMQ